MLANWSFERARLFFLVAAIYDIALGVAFTFVYDPILDWLDIIPPDNKSYIHLASVFVLVQGLSYLIVARDVAGNAGLVLAGILYKFGYSAVAVYYLAIDELLHWIFFAFGIADMVFLLGFLATFMLIRREHAAAL